MHPAAPATVSHAVVGLRTEVADVVMDSRSAGREATYTYANPIGVRRGDAVIVSLGPRQVIGYVVRVRSVTEPELGFPLSALKPVVARIEGVSLPEPLMDLLEDIGRQTLSTISTVLTLAMPPGIKDRLVTEWTVLRTPDAGERSGLSAVQQETLRTIESAGGSLMESKAKPLAAPLKRQFRALKAAGFLAETLRVAPFSERHRLSGHLRLTGDEDKIEKFLTKEGKRKPAQALIVMRLQGAEATSFSAQEIKALSGSTDQAIHGLLQAGLLDRVDVETFALSEPPQPNPHQQAAMDAIVHAVREGRFESFLLYGVTGSGKTEVYLRAAAETLAQGRQVLYLVPEIALTAQVIAQLRSRFGKGVAVLHSNLAPQERLANWLRIATGDAPVVIGARSALFSPVQNLGLILVDEEHEGSYKQESAPRYHARESAVFLAQRLGIPVVLGSATPSLESYHAAQNGELTLLSLPQRAAAARMPEVYVQDLAELYKEKHRSLFSPILFEKMTAALGRGEQVILFLNRRAYSSFLLCRDCGHQFMCPQCAVTLSYHKRIHKLRCHHCAYEEPAPDLCPACESPKIAPFGTGAEKVEEAVRNEFPEITVARLDRDIAAKKGALEETLALFRSQAIQVLVGTQMVAKGLDFPNVTVVGVIAADISLNLPDFRAGERTFQLLSQVAGRAGRGSRPGEVVIQTLSPKNLAIEAAAEHDYERYFAAAIEERREANYPPFCHLVNIIFSGEKKHDVDRAALQMAGALIPFQEEIKVLGPVECPLERLQNQWRRHILLKLPSRDILGRLAPVLQATPPDGVTVVLDVNPYSMM
jgi:primosomal protein N' (replication factor Y)